MELIASAFGWRYTNQQLTQSISTALNCHTQEKPLVPRVPAGVVVVEGGGEGVLNQYLGIGQAAEGLKPWSWIGQNPQFYNLV